MKKRQGAARASSLAALAASLDTRKRALPETPATVTSKDALREALRAKPAAPRRESKSASPPAEAKSSSRSSAAGARSESKASSSRDASKSPSSRAAVLPRAEASREMSKPSSSRDVGARAESKASSSRDVPKSPSPRAVVASRAEASKPASSRDVGARAESKASSSRDVPKSSSSRAGVASAAEASRAESNASPSRAPSRVESKAPSSRPGVGRSSATPSRVDSRAPQSSTISARVESRSVRIPTLSPPAPVPRAVALASLAKAPSPVPSRTPTSRPVGSTSTPPAADARRRYPRADLTVKARLSLADDPSRVFEAALPTVNISVGGLFLQSSFYLKLGTKLLVHLSLPPGGREVTVKSEVVRVETVGGSGGFALRFIEYLDGSEVALATHFLSPVLREFISSYAKQHRFDASPEYLAHTADVLAAWELKKAELGGDVWQMTWREK